MAGVRLRFLLSDIHCDIRRREGSFKYELFSFWKREISDIDLREVESVDSSMPIVSFSLLVLLHRDTSRVSLAAWPNAYNRRGRPK